MTENEKKMNAFLSLEITATSNHYYYCNFYHHYYIVLVLSSQKLTPGQDDVSEGNEVNYNGGYTQSHYGQPAEKRHGPVESACERHRGAQLVPSVHVHLAVLECITIPYLQCMLNTQKAQTTVQSVPPTELSKADLLVGSYSVCKDFNIFLCLQKQGHAVGFQNSKDVHVRACVWCPCAQPAAVSHFFILSP